MGNWRRYYLCTHQYKFGRNFFISFIGFIVFLWYNIYIYINIIITSILKPLSTWSRQEAWIRFSLDIRILAANPYNMKELKNLFVIKISLPFVLVNLKEIYHMLFC